MRSGIKKKKSVGFVQVYESRRKDRPPTGRIKNKKGQHVCMGSRIFSHYAAPSSLLMTVLWGGKGTAAFSCLSQLVEGLQKHVASKRTGVKSTVWSVERRELFKIAKFRNCFISDTISNALGLHTQKAASFPLSSLFLNHSLTSAQITASHSEHGVENSLSCCRVRKTASKSQNLFPRVQK